MEQKRIAARNTLLFGCLIASTIFLLLLVAIFRTRNFFKEISNPQSTKSLSHYNFINQSDVEVNANRIISWEDNEENTPDQRRNVPKRDKRFIIFNGNGVVKLVLGTSFPIQLVDRVRSLSSFYNLQMQYIPIPRPVYWWSLYNTTTFPGSLRKARMTTGDRIELDISRDFIYTAIEAALETAGLPGAQCLLSMICEISRQPFHINRNIADSESWAQRNLIHEILNAIFTDSSRGRTPKIPRFLCVPVRFQTGRDVKERGHLILDQKKCPTKWDVHCTLPKLPNIDTKYIQAHHNGVHGANCRYNCPKHKNWLDRRSVFI